MFLSHPLPSHPLLFPHPPPQFPIHSSIGLTPALSHLFAWMGLGRGKGRGRGGMDDDDMEMLVMGGGCCCFLAILIAGICVGCSFSILRPAQGGVAQNTLSKTIDDSVVYTSGRYWLGISRSFVVYPLSLQNIEFSGESEADGAPLGTESSEGRVTIEASLQYRLKLEKLVNLYRKYETAFHDKFVRIAQSAIQSTASEVTSAREFFTQRRALQEDFLAATKDALASDFATVEAFQLRKVELPSKLEDQIVAALRSQEEERTVDMIRQQQVLNANITIIEEETDADVAVIRANKTFEATVLRARAEADATAELLDARSDTFSILRDTADLTTEEITRLRFYRDLVEDIGSEGKIIAGFDDSSDSISENVT